MTLLLLNSCFKKNEFDTVPHIEYDSFTSYGDSARIIFNFTDGEGDIGLEDSQTESPYNFGSPYYYNIYIEYLEKDDAEGYKYVTDPNGDTVSFPIRIHPILDPGEEKATEGKIEVSLSPLYYNPFSDQSDTIKYRIQLIDRGLNKSNWIESEEIVR